MVGSRVTQNPDEVLKTVQDGHQIAVHTWTHHPLTSLTNEQIVAEIKFTEAAIYKAIGKVPTYFRPPYGDADDRVRAIVNALGYRMIMWTSVPDRDTHDTGVITPADKALVLNTVKGWKTTQPGFISLEHDVSAVTADIAVSILKDLKDTGTANPLKAMPVGTCLGDSNWYSEGNQNPNNPNNPDSKSNAAHSNSIGSTVNLVVIGGIVYSLVF